jgi:hypothetical protein
MSIPSPKNVTPVSKDKLDTRSDNEIAHQLRTFSPPTESEKNVWGYWHTGFDSMPPWTQRNVINWVRRFGSSWTVRVVDSVPGSPNNISRFVENSFFPDAFNVNRLTGSYAGVHSADLVRLPLLYLYGGIWMDVGTLLIRSLDDIWGLLKDPETPYEMAAMTIPLRRDEAIMTNSFLASVRHNPFIHRWHRLFFTIWEHSSDCVGAHAHPLLSHLRPYSAPGSEANEPSIPSSDKEMSDYLAHMLCAERVRDLVDTDDGFDGRAFYEHKIFLLPILREGCYLQRQTGWDGPLQLRLLQTSLNILENEREDEFNRARDLVHDLLQNTTLIKLGHGPKGVTTPWLADLWDKPRYRDADHAPGTFAAYLRKMSLEFNQTRKLNPLDVSVSEKLWHAGLLEPCGLN